MKYAFIHEHADQFPILAMCRVLEVSRSGCYAAKNRPLSLRSREDVALRERIERLHEAHRQTPGIIKTWRLLRAEGCHAGRNRIARLRRLAGVQTKRARRFANRRSYKKEQPPAPNLLERRFQTGESGKAWVGDMTAIPTRHEGMLHLAAFLDIGTRMVSGWATGASQTAELAVAALQKGVRNHQISDGMICHTDQGSPFASTLFRNFLSQHSMRASMSRKGNCHDNAVAESFFSTLKNEFLHHQMFDDHASAHAAIAEFIDVYYNHQRLHQTLGYRTPAEFQKAAPV